MLAIGLCGLMVSGRVRVKRANDSRQFRRTDYVGSGRLGGVRVSSNYGAVKAVQYAIAER